MKFSDLADEPAIVITTYLFVFVPWTAVASLDFISAQWKSVRHARHDAQYHLFFAIAPTFFIGFYIAVQISAKDYKEMAAAVVALIFSLHHVARTVWAIAQLAAFRSWAVDAILALEEHGIKYSSHCSPSHSDAAEIADCLFINEDVIDNQLLHGSPRCFLQYADLNLRVNLDPHLHGPHRIASHLSGRILNVFQVISVPFRILFNSLVKWLRISDVEKPYVIRQVPHEPISLWLTWATVFVAQGLSQWVSDFNVSTDPDSLTTATSQSSLSSPSSSKPPEKNFEERRAYFAGEILSSAIFHTMPQTSDVAKRPYPSPFNLLSWDSDSNTAHGRLTKQDLLKHALLDGRALPFSTPHPHAHDENGAMTYSTFAIKLQRMTEGMPDKFGQAILDFDVERLEWLAILLHLGFHSREQRSKFSANQTNSSSPTGNQFTAPNDSADAQRKGFQCEDDNAVRNLHHQLGFKYVTENQDDNKGILTLSSFPFSSVTHPSVRSTPRNRLTLRCGEYIDAWLALNAGDDVSFLQERNHYWRETFNPDAEQVWQLERKGFYDSFPSLRTYHHQLEMARIDHQFACPRHRYQHLDNTLTFMGYSMEVVRTLLAEHVKNNSGFTGFWPIRERASGDSGIDVGQLSIPVSVALQSSLDSVATAVMNWLRVCILTEIQQLCHTYYSSHVDALEILMIMAVVSFPSISIKFSEHVNITPSQNNNTVGIQVSAHVIDVTIAAVGAPQNVDVRGSIQIEPQSNENSLQGKVSLCLVSRDATQAQTGSRNQSFNWESWRDAFTARLEGHKEWQESHSFASPLVFWTDHPIISGIKSIPTPMSGIGKNFDTWTGWMPFRPQFARFELESADFLKQTVGSRHFFQEHYSWLDDEFVAADFPHQPRQSVSYNDAGLEVLRYGSLIVMEQLFYSDSTSSSLASTSSSNMSMEEQASSLLAEAGRLLEQPHGGVDSAIFLLEFGACELGHLDALDQCINLLIAQNDLNRATAIVRRYISHVERQPCVELAQMDARSEALSAVVPIFERIVNKDEFSVNVLPHFVAFVRMVPCFWASESSAKKVRQRIRRAFMHSRDVRLIANLAQMAYDKQRTWARGEGGYLIRKTDNLGTTYAIVNIKKVGNYQQWLEDSGNLLKYGYLERVEAELYNNAAPANADEHALINLAHMLRLGPAGIECNWLRAFKLYSRAIEIQSRPDAYYFQGVMLKDGGYNLRKDKVEAAKCFEKAKADGYHDRPVVAKDLMLLMDNALPPDEVKNALERLESIGATSKNTMVICNVAQILLFGVFGAQKNWQKAKELYVRAMELGSDSATQRLVDVVYEDRDEDFLKAAELCCRAIVERQSVVSMYTLGNMLRTGKGVRRNGKIACDLFESVMQAGDLSGAQNLATIYHVGYDDVPKNSEKAKLVCRKELQAKYTTKIATTLGAILLDSADDVERAEGVQLLEKVIQEDSGYIKALYELSLFYQNNNHQFYNGKRSHELHEKILELVSTVDEVLDMEVDRGFHALNIWHENHKETLSISWTRVLQIWEAATATDTYQSALLQTAINYKTGNHGVVKDDQRAEERLKKLLRHMRWASGTMKFVTGQMILNEDHGFVVDKRIGLDLFIEGGSRGSDQQKLSCARFLLFSELPSRYTSSNFIEQAVRILENIVSNVSDEPLTETQSSARCVLASILFEGREPIGQDKARAQALLEEGIQRGNSEVCMNWLGKVLGFGMYRVERDPAYAERLFEMSLEKNDSQIGKEVILAALAALKTENPTVPRLKSAISLWQRLIDEFPIKSEYSAEARIKLSRCYLNGYGVEEANAKVAHKLLEECVRGCDILSTQAESAHILATLLLLSPCGVPRDADRARRLMMLAREELDIDSQIPVLFSDSLFNGRNVVNEIEELYPNWRAKFLTTEGPLGGEPKLSCSLSLIDAPQLNP